MNDHVDPTWEEEIYAQGLQLNRYPFDMAVSFVFRYRPQLERGATRVLEVGCGAGNNLWFAAREGFQVAGLDSSQKAIDFARERFAQEGLTADLRVGSFAELPWPDESFHLVIDRGALTNVPMDVCQRAVDEVRRVIAPGGRFHFNPYSDRSSSYISGQRDKQGMTHSMTVGYSSIGAMRFYGRSEIDRLMAGWKLLSLQHIEWLECAQPQCTLNAEWLAVLEKG